MGPVGLTYSDSEANSLGGMVWVVVVISSWC